MQRTPRPKRLVLALFFASGVAGLIYEVVWTRLLERVMGASVYSITTVLTVYMAGLALGSFLAGKVIDRRSDPLRVYGILEGAIGVYCVLVPAIVAATVPIYRAAYQSLAGGAHTWSFVRFAISAIVLIVPTTLMGATLPVLSKYFTTRYDSLGHTVGELYALNTLGAVVGSFAAGFALLPLLGLRGAIAVAAALNVGIALVVLLVYYRDRGRDGAAHRKPVPDARGHRVAAEREKDGAKHRDSGAAPEKHRAQAEHARVLPSPGLLAFVLVVFGVSGFAAMVYQVAWMRALSLVIGSSVYAVSLTLTAYILGLALGAAVFSRLVDRNRDLVTTLAWLEIGVGASALAVAPVIGRLPLAVIGVIENFSHSFPLLMAIEFLIVFLIILVPTMLLGGVFPVVVKLFTKRLESVGRSVGDAYASNTVGAIVGSFAAGFVLIPWIGIQRSIAIGVVVSVALGAALAILSPAAPRVRKVAAAAVGLIVLGLSMAPGLRWDPVIMSSGAYLYADMYAEQAQAWDMTREDAVRLFGKILYHKEGLATTVTVRQARSDLYLQANGKTEASTGPDMRTQKLLAHVPMLLHSDPKSVLVIGLASGVTVGSAEKYRGVERIECVEIAPAMKEVAATFFAEANGHCLDDPRLSVIIEDGRNHVAFTDATYDVIVSQPSNPWISGISNLFTREFFDLARARLAEDGVVGLWFQAYNMSPAEFRMIARTFASVFEHASLWELDPGVDYMLVGTKGPGVVDWGLAVERLADPDVGADLSSIGVRSALDWIGLFVAGGDGLREYAGPGPLHTDDGLELEFSAPRNMYRKSKAEQLAALDAFRSDPGSLLTGIPEADEDSVRAAVAERASARKLLATGLVAEDAGKGSEAVAAYRAAAAAAPGDRTIAEALSRILCQAGSALSNNNDLAGAVAYFQDAVAAGPEFPQPHSLLGSTLFRLGRIEEARAELLKALEIDPRYADAHLNMALVFDSLGMVREEIAALRSYLESAPTASNVAEVKARIEELERGLGGGGAEPRP